MQKLLHTKQGLLTVKLVRHNYGQLCIRPLTGSMMFTLFF